MNEEANDAWAARMWAFLNHVDQNDADRIVDGLMHSSIKGCLRSENSEFFVRDAIRGTIRGLLARTLAAESTMSEQALNALRALAGIPIERCPAGATDDWIIFNFNDYVITLGHVRDARAALTHADGKGTDNIEGRQS